MDLLKSMRTFIRVAKSGSFALAADQGNVSRSLASKHVKDLEEHVGAQLIRRTTRSLDLTDAGIRYLEFCARILEDIEEHRTETARAAKEAVGEVKLLAPKSFGNTQLAACLCDLIAKHPRISVSLILSDDTLTSLDLIGSGVDFAIRLSEPSRASLVAQRIGNLRWLLCASPNYIEEHGCPLHPNELKMHICLLHLKHYPDAVWRLSNGGATFEVKVTGAFAANSSLALRTAALQGLGIALLPAYCIDADLKQGNLLPILTCYEVASQAIYALYSNQRNLPLKVRIVIDHLSAAFGVTETPPALNSRPNA